MYNIRKIFSEFGEQRGIGLMLADDLNINAQDRHGVTLLMWAANCGYFNIVKFLIKKGAKLETEKESALLNALRFRNEKVFLLLLNKGVNVSFTDNGSFDVFDFALFFARIRFVDLMLKKGENINKADKD